jgi:DNA-binding transcriptional MerR regulator
MNSLSLNEVAARTGVKPRTLQLWTDAGALQALPGSDRKGSGAHRLYQESELEIAVVLMALAGSFRIPVGKLKGIAEDLRSLFAAKSDPAEDTPLIANLARARKGVIPVWLSFTYEGKNGRFEWQISGGALGGLGALKTRPCVMTVNLTSLLTITKPKSE